MPNRRKIDANSIIRNAARTFVTEVPDLVITSATILITKKFNRMSLLSVFNQFIAVFLYSSIPFIEEANFVI